MTSVALDDDAVERAGERLAAAPLWTWCLLAFALIALRAWMTAGQGLANDLGDMDDATRLVQVRAWMTGAPWYDTWTATMGGKAGMLSHWSRFIDLPIATLLYLFGLLLPAERAELAVRAIWPLLTLAPLLWVMARAAETLAGRTAALITLALAAACPMGLYQFNAGRIDHHNVMIAASVSSVLLMAAWPSSQRVWRLCGILAGVALAVGYEALAPIAALSIAVAALGLFSPTMSDAARRYVEALIATFTLSFVATIAPGRWLDIRCDAISLNMVLLLAIGGAGLWAALASSRKLGLRLGLVAASGVLGLAVFGMLEPKCLAGPFGQMPAELKTVWLDTVGENRSIAADLVRGDIEQSLGLIVYYALGLVAAWRLYRTDRSQPKLLLLALCAAFVAFALWQYKYLSYASFLLTVPLAVRIATLDGIAGLSASVTRVAACILASQALAMQASKFLDAKLHGADKLQAGRAFAVPPQACLKSDAIRELAELPPGLIAARIDMGAYIVALTPHHVLSAPYHRIADAILANHKIFAAKTPEAAAGLLAREGIDYVVTCRGLDDPYVGEPKWQGTFRADLVAGRAPAFLTRVPLANPRSIYSVWKVDKAQLAAVSPRP